MKIFYVQILCLAVLFTVSPYVQGQNLNGEEVLDNVKQAMDASSADIELRMELYSSSGSKRERQLIAKIKETNGLSKSYIEFTSPPDVEGTAFLSLEQSKDNEEMYLYMPVLGSARRIAGSQKNGSFVGTDFTYNDLSILGGGEYTEDYQASVLQAGDEEYLLKLTPADKSIDYSYTKMWVPVSNWVPTKIEFYDKGENLEKLLTNEQIEQVDGYWVGRKIIMENVQKDTRTELYIEKIQYDVSLDDQIFTTRHLGR